MRTLPPNVVSIAILYREGQFLLQLRDSISGILYPGHWGFFGGHVEAGETPEVAMRRELIEEIGYEPPEVFHFDSRQEGSVLRHIYHAPLTVDIQDLTLYEGWDLRMLTPEDIQRGEHYSARADEVRPIGKPHQKILLDFLAQVDEK
ncbi:MAG: NUDIX domain-containing protein [Gloeobacterales cyanobacterium]